MRRAGLFLCLYVLTALAADKPWPTSGWQVSTPEAQGMDSAALEGADAWIRANSPNRYSLLVIRNGYLVFERYYGGAGMYDARHAASISKSFLSALTGVAIEQGLVSLDDRWFETYPEYTYTVQNPATTDLRLRQMLMMSGGLAWQEGLAPIRDQWMPTSDWMRFVLLKDFMFAPGEAFHYSTGLTHMLSGFLTRRTGLSTREFARQNLFEPLGITMGEWWRDPQGVYTGGFGMHLTPRDLAKFGYLYLRDGAWEGRQVLPPSWVRASTAPQIRCGAGTDDFYGYLWWMDNQRGFFVPSARGMGSQRIWFSRELDLLAVTTGDYANSVTGDTTRLMLDYVIPSVFHGAPHVNEGGVVNAASSSPVIAPDSFVSIYGDNLAPVELTWDSVILDGKTLPRELAGVRVKVAGKDAYISYAGPRQVNVLVPPDVEPGPVEVEVSHPGGTVRSAVLVASVSPALFSVALFAGTGVYVAPPGTYQGVESRAAVRGDNLELYATGLGRTAAAHPAGEALVQHYPAADPASIRVFFGDIEVTPQAVNMTYAGLWQVNVKAPDNCATGMVKVKLRAANETSPAIDLPVACPG